MGRIVLDDRVADDTGLASLYDVHLALTRADAAIARPWPAGRLPIEAKACAGTARCPAPIACASSA